MFALEPNETIANGIRRIVLEKIDQTSALIAGIEEGPETAVHETRKNFKRLRAVLRLAREALPDTVYRAENIFYRDLSRRFAELRGAAVLTETMRLIRDDDAPAGSPPPFPILSALADAQSRGIYAGVTAARFDATLSALAGARRRIEGWEFTAPGAAALRFGLLRTVRRTASAYRRAYKNPRTNRKFHEWRKQVKYLWHQAEVLRPFGTGDLNDRIEVLRHLSSLLGAAHDVVDLENWLPTVQAEAPADEMERIMPGIRFFRLDHEGAARPFGRLLFSAPQDLPARWFPRLPH